MRKILTGFCIVLLIGSVNAQKVNTDSLKLVSTMSSDQLKLGQLQNQVEGRIKDKQDAAAKAQASADENQKSASDLSTNPQDKALARQASRKASQAKRDARKARKAADRLDDLNKDIGKLKDKVSRTKQKLDHDFPGPAVAPLTAPVNPVDSSRS